MPAQGRSGRDDRRRRLGQNFLEPERAERFVANAGIGPGDFVVEIGAGRGALTRALARRGAEVLTYEIDPVWARRLRADLAAEGTDGVQVVEGDFLAAPLPRRAYRVVACPPFAATTAILERLLRDPGRGPWRADLIVQWEVARKRAACPPATLRSAAWAPWWEFALGARLPARAFRPVPRVDAGVLVITRRDPPVLPEVMAADYARFVQARWPFAAPAPAALRRSGAPSPSGRARGGSTAGASAARRRRAPPPS